MVITVTLNPTTDRTLEVPDFRVGQHARARLVALVPAGKGVNVARGLALLGGRATACGLVGRGEQEAYRESLRRDGAECAMCAVDGVTRSNTTIIDPQNGTTTHLREQGFTVTGADLERLRASLADAVAGSKADGRRPSVVFAGSAPPGVGPEDFVELLALCREAGASVVVDTSGDALVASVESGCADTIKPNLLELGECLGEEVSRGEAPARAAELLDKVRTVLLTLGADGAYVIRRDGCEGMRCRIDQSRVRNNVGCGDAFLAGWLYGMERAGDVSTALRWAVAAGAASALSPITVGYNREEVERLLDKCGPLESQRM